MTIHLQLNPVLKQLNLAYNGFADKGAIALADALKVNSTLVDLDVRWCIESELDRPKLSVPCCPVSIAITGSLNLELWRYRKSSLHMKDCRLLQYVNHPHAQ
jgi:hypothetical protein